MPTIDRVFATLLQLVGAKGAQGKISGTGTGNQRALGLVETSETRGTLSTGQLKGRGRAHALVNVGT